MFETNSCFYELTACQICQILTKYLSHLGPLFQCPVHACFTLEFQIMHICLNHEQVTCKIHTQLKKHQHIRLMYFNLIKTVITVCNMYYNIKNLCILPTNCVHMFKMILTIKSNYFLKHGYVCGLCN